MMIIAKTLYRNHRLTYQYTLTCDLCHRQCPWWAPTWQAIITHARNNGWLLDTDMNPWTSLCPTCKESGHLPECAKCGTPMCSECCGNGCEAHTTTTVKETA
ncbi:hypothetical protein [Bifidobacterium pseudolongum]|uniref:hypothetical protein n=1 Tax=Bifidobacterium pseudolongum TaxID=1694 RepID=UPI00101F9DC7|nr:hypothetical protein [Bifidobacterium pseudolongum]